MKKLIIAFLILFSIPAFSQYQLTEIKNLQDQVSVLTSSVSKLEANSKSKLQDIAIWGAIIAASIAAIVSIRTTYMSNKSEMKINNAKLDFEKYKLKYSMKKEAFDFLLKIRNHSKEIDPNSDVVEKLILKDLKARNSQTETNLYNVKPYINHKKIKNIDEKYKPINVRIVTIASQLLLEEISKKDAYALLLNIEMEKSVLNGEFTDLLDNELAELSIFLHAE